MHQTKTQKLPRRNNLIQPCDEVKNLLLKINAVLTAHNIEKERI
jgi:hypothetical protein